MDVWLNPSMHQSWQLYSCIKILCSIFGFVIFRSRIFSRPVTETFIVTTTLFVSNVCGHSYQMTVFTGYLPGAAVRFILLHVFLIDLSCSLQNLYTTSMSLQRSPSLVHVFFLESTLETIHGLNISIFMWQIIPSTDDPLWKEVQTCITTTMLLHQFPSVSSGWGVFGLLEKMTKEWMTISLSF